MRFATIAEIGGVLCVKCNGYAWRRVHGQWEMCGANGEWFAREISDSAVARQVADFENCLRSYSFDAGPEYPQGSKRGGVGAFFRELQRKELVACTKNIFG